MQVLVSGGAGFLGYHLCKRLLARGDRVICLDDLSTGSSQNVASLSGEPGFTFSLTDVVEPWRPSTHIDVVVHLASAASPTDYARRPLETLAVGSRGTENMLAIAREHGARFVLASTSEVYGEPLVHPQSEGYWGNVNPVGPRSMYDEAKRYAEAVTAVHARSFGTNTGIVRIFNTYGPRMRADDGRVVAAFATQALNGDPLTVFGDGNQTRSLCYVDDLVGGLVAMLDSSAAGPVNLGNPVELTVLELARLIISLSRSRSRIVHRPLPPEDPTRRRPDIGLAADVLDWRPTIEVADGLTRTIGWFRDERGGHGPFVSAARTATSSPADPTSEDRARRTVILPAAP